MLPSSSNVEPDLLIYTLRIFDADVVTESSTNHALRFSLSTSFACLKTYFLRQPLVPVNLVMGDLIIGETVLNMEVCDLKIIIIFVFCILINPYKVMINPIIEDNLKVKQ